MMHHLTILVCLLLLASSGMANPEDAKETPAEELSWLKQKYSKVAFVGPGHHVERTESEDGHTTIKIVGMDPYNLTNIKEGDIAPLAPYRIGFQYRLAQEMAGFQIIYKTPLGIQWINGNLDRAEDWKWQFFELPAGAPVDWLRFDFGNVSGRQIELRDCRLIKAVEPFEVSDLKHAPFSLQTKGNQATVRQLAEGGWEILTIGNDPYVGTKGFAQAYDPATPYILAFEYQAPEDFGDMLFYFRTEDGTQHTNAAVKPADEWTWHLFDFTLDGQGRRQEIKSFRIDFGSRENLRFKIRNFRMIEATHELRIRASIGDKADRLDQFGISLQNVEHQQSAVETVRHADKKSVAVTMATYRHVDLDAETKRLATEPSAQPPVPLGPRIVAGEGAHPDNHTVVRILSPYQVCETQFLAFPPEIRGGVGVEAGKGSDGEAFIVAWPLAPGLGNEVRVFNRSGGWIGSLNIPKEIPSSYTVAVGDFHAGLAGDEIAVAAKVSKDSIPTALLYSSTGKLIKKLPIPGTKGNYSLLTIEGNPLMAQDLSRQIAYPLTKDGKVVSFEGAPDGHQLFDSAFSDRDFNAGGPQEKVSTLYPWKDGKRSQALNVGRMENIFWFDPQEVHGGDRATWGPFPQGKYIRSSLYNFLGTAQYWSPLVDSGEIEGRSYEEWTEIDWEEVFRPSHRKSVREYDSGVPTVWTAAFSHRWHIQKMKRISAKLDPKTWLPRYLLLDRKNDPTGGGYFGKKLFDYGSQHFEDEALDKLYTYAQRAFHRKLAPAYRQNPEMAIAIEPNHENEIVSGGDSIGDYNPGNLQGFYHYLLAVYGSLESINLKMGTDFSTKFFDAPRNIFRGSWDRYHVDNRYYREWIEYNRIVISRRVGSSYREALLAGFPPEMIKCHQIPDSYVFGSIVGISEGQKRISPIDWLLTTGAGFGFSRYGTYYDREHNIGQGAYSSGFDGMLIGEYAALNPSAEKSLEQLLYLRNHGVSALHVMWWPKYLDKGFNRAQEVALQEMVTKHDVPRPGFAGGVGQVRPYRGKAGVFDIASLGTGARNTGLIKSLKADGSFEGTVYTVPFHAHVDIDVLKNKEMLTIHPKPTLLANVKDIRPGCVVEVLFTVGNISPSNEIRIDFACNGIRLADKAVKLNELQSGQNVRVVYKLPLVLENVELSIASSQPETLIKGVSVYQHQDQVVNLSKDIMEGKRHQGGVTFDWLP